MAVRVRGHEGHEGKGGLSIKRQAMKEPKAARPVKGMAGRAKAAEPVKARP